MQRAQAFQKASSSMMESPSNQIYYGNCTCLFPEEYKVIGMTRSHPLPLVNTPSKYPSIVNSINGQTEGPSSNNGSTFDFEPGTSSFRKGYYCSTSKGVFDGDFLTLAPPTTTSMSSTSKFKHPQSNLINCELAYQAGFEDSILRQGVTGTESGSNEYRPYYSFFPPAMVQIEQATTLSMADCNGEVGYVYLDLKL